MTKILIVDDSPVERQLAGRLLEKQPDLTVLTAGNGTQQILAGELADVIGAIRGAASSTSAGRQSAVTT